VQGKSWVNNNGQILSAIINLIFDVKNILAQAKGCPPQNNHAQTKDDKKKLMPQ